MYELLKVSLCIATTVFDSVASFARVCPCVLFVLSDFSLYINLCFLYADYVVWHAVVHFPASAVLTDSHHGCFPALTIIHFKALPIRPNTMILTSVRTNAQRRPGFYSNQPCIFSSQLSNLPDVLYQFTPALSKPFTSISASQPPEPTSTPQNPLLPSAAMIPVCDRMVVMGMDGTGGGEFKPVLVVPAGQGSGRRGGDATRGFGYGLRAAFEKLNSSELELKVRSLSINLSTSTTQTQTQTNTTLSRPAHPTLFIS